MSRGSVRASFVEAAETEQIVFLEACVGERPVAGIYNPVRGGRHQARRGSCHSQKIGFAFQGVVEAALVPDSWPIGIPHSQSAAFGLQVSEADHGPVI